MEICICNGIIEGPLLNDGPGSGGISFQRDETKCAVLNKGMVQQTNKIHQPEGKSGLKS